MNGVLLISIGNPVYSRWAENMIVSLRHNSPDVCIHVLTDGNYINQNGLADKVIQLAYEDYHTENGKLFPAKAKLSMYKYAEFDKTIYLDVDGIAIKDITPLFDLEGYFQVQVNGVSTLDHDNLEASLWVKSSVIIDKFNLPENSVIPGTNSSFQFFTKSKEAEELYSKALDNLLNHSFTINELRYTWGKSGTQPDELYMNIALAQTNLIPDMKPVLYIRQRGKGGAREPLEKIISERYIICCFGGSGYNHHEITGTGDIRSGLYNKLCINYFNELGLKFYDHYYSLIKGKVYDNAIK